MTKRIQAAIGYLVLIGTGVALLLPHFFISHHTLLAMLIGGLLPALLAVSIISSAGLIYYEGVTSGEVIRIAFWTLAVGLVGAGIAGSMIVYEWSRGVELTGVAFVISNSAVGGATCGLIVGVYSADRYATKQKLQKNQHRISALNERLTVLNRVLRHDIRNDVNVIQGYAELIEQGRADAETALQMIQQKSTEIADFSERAREIERLMQASTQEREPLDLVPILQREIEEVREGYLGVEIEADLLDTARVEASPLVESAIDNLVENAVEHNDKPTARVVVTLEPDDGGYHLEVSDNGPGLPAYERRLLEGGEETKLEHSDGIGLWLVNWIVEESNGRVSVEEADDSGTTIAVWLPRPTGKPAEAGGATGSDPLALLPRGEHRPTDEAPAASPPETARQFG
jgi:signal transduction histidine kinase